MVGDGIRVRRRALRARMAIKMMVQARTTMNKTPMPVFTNMPGWLGGETSHAVWVPRQEYVPAPYVPAP